MHDIYIPQLLKMPRQKEEIKINNEIQDLKTLTPVKGILIVTHGGNFLKIELEAETILTLSCDRCLQQYNYKLQVKTDELIWLANEFEIDKSIPLEREISVDNLSETLPPDSYFETENWIYQQLSLSMPIRQLCSNNCKSPEIKQKENLLDSRWASLASLNGDGVIG